METTFCHPFIASILAAIVTTIGLVTINKHRKWAEDKTVYFSTFASGVLISVSFLHIIPESIEMAPHAPFAILAGYFMFHMINRFIHTFVCDRKTSINYSIGLIPMAGIGLHSFIDGMVYSIAFTASIFTGVMTVIGLILHEFPEGIVTYILLRKSGFTNKTSLLLSFITAGLTTPAGMLISYPFVSNISNNSLGILLGFSAGSLIYVGATHLLPKIEHEAQKFSVLSLATGILVAAIIVMSE